MSKIERELYRYGDLMKQAQELEEKVRELAAKKIEIVDSMLRPVKKYYDFAYDEVEKLVDVYDTHIRELIARIGEIYAEYWRIKEHLDAAGLNEYEQRYIKRRYVDRMAHSAITLEFGYCERQIGRICKSALKKLEKTK